MEQDLVTCCSIYCISCVLEDPETALPRGEEEGAALAKAVGLVCLCLNCPITPGLLLSLVILVFSLWNGRCN